MSNYEAQGYSAFQAGTPITSCPLIDTNEHPASAIEAWHNGWYAAEYESKGSGSELSSGGNPKMMGYNAGLSGGSDMPPADWSFADQCSFTEGYTEGAEARWAEQLKNSPNVRPNDMPFDRYVDDLYGGFDVPE